MTSATSHAPRIYVYPFLVAAMLACRDRGADNARSVDGTPVLSGANRYAPRTREIAITTVPLLVKEQTGVLPFLKADFAKGGVLEGKEVYAFSPSVVTVVEGDTIHFTLINPEDDVHSFVLPDLAVPLPPQKVTTATYVARRAGIYPFVCSVAAHLPMMWGQLIVLSSTAMESAARSGGALTERRGDLVQGKPQ